MKLCKQCRKPECPNGDFDEGMEMAASMFRTGLDASIEEFKRQQDVDSLSRVSASIAGARAACVSLLALVDAVESKIGTRPCPEVKWPDAEKLAAAIRAEWDEEDTTGEDDDLERTVARALARLKRR